MANKTLEQLLQPKDATRLKSKACIVIEGLSGSGKTGLALLLGYHLAGKNWQKVNHTDTENKSANLYVGETMSNGVTIPQDKPFKKIDLLATYGFAPTTYLICKENSIKQGMLVHINDSITHMWQMKDGVLQQVTALEKANSRVNKYSAWGDPSIVAEKNAIYDVTRDSRIHVISTVRIKEKHEMVTIDGKTQIKSLGDQEIFMPDFKYEPDLVLRMVQPGNRLGTPPVAEVIKSRYTPLQPGETYSFTESLIEQLVSYLEEGTDPEVLLEQQRLDYIEAITKTLDTNPSKATMFPILKEQIGCKETKLTDLPLDKVRTLLGMLIN